MHPSVTSGVRTGKLAQAKTRQCYQSYGLSYYLTRRANDSVSVSRDNGSFGQRAQANIQLRNSGNTGVGTEENTGMTHDPGNIGVFATPTRIQELEGLG
jgi:hypothetical protein